MKYIIICLLMILGYSSFMALTTTDKLTVAFVPPEPGQVEVFEIDIEEIPEAPPPEFYEE